MKTREKLEQEIGENEEELRLLAGKIGVMTRTPKYDASYSSAKLANWQNDLERLQKKDIELHEQLGALINSDAYQKAHAQKVAQLKAKRETVFKELRQVTEQLKVWQRSAQNTVAEGGDALKLANERFQLEERETVLTYAAQLLNGAIQQVSK